MGVFVSIKCLFLYQINMSRTGPHSHHASNQSVLSNFILTIRGRPACFTVQRAAQLFAHQAHKNGSDDELSQFALRVLVQALHLGHPEHGLRQKIHTLMILLREYGNEIGCDLWPLFRLTLGRTLIGEIDSDFGSIACDLFGRGFVTNAVRIASRGGEVRTPSEAHNDRLSSIVNAGCKP